MSTILKHLGFERAIDITSETITNSGKLAILEQVKDFGIDEVYFCDDNQNNTYPAVFIKKINSFNEATLKEIVTIQKNIWNYKKVLFLYVSTDTEIRIYNCSEKPPVLRKSSDLEKELENLEIKKAVISDKESLDELQKVFSSIAIDTGIIWTLEEAVAIRNKINLQRRVDKFLVESLFRTAKELQSQGLTIDLIHKIMMRSLFLLYLEDRGATDIKFYSQFQTGAESYFDVLDNVEATYNLFGRLANRFNGSLFTLTHDEICLNITQLHLIKECFINGNDGSNQTTIFTNWRLFNFKIIQIELLSEIYENFLAKINPEIKQQTGTFYTPPSLVELILNEKLPVNTNEKNYNIKILDPACGSGIFLVESFKRIVKRYENKHGQKLTDFNTLKKLLTDNIFGIELQEQAIKVAAFSLYLALIDSLNPKTIWQNEENTLPNLINNPKDVSLTKQGNNLFCRDTIDENKEIESLEFDLIVGNPPFGTKNLLPSVRNYCEQNGFAKEMVLPFLHKSINFAPKGEIALIFNTKVLTNTGSSYQNFRKWLFSNTYVEKIYNFSILRNAPKNFGGQLFGAATGPISIVFYKKEKPENPSNRIAYYAPKTFIKTNVLEGVTIDSTDLKFLPRKECEKPDTKIWKIAMWGEMNDFHLIQKISTQFQSIKTFLSENISTWNFGSGLHSPSLKQIQENNFFIPEKKVINLRKVNRYYTLDSALSNSNKKFRLIDKNLFRPPFLIIKEGQKEKEFCASIIDYESYHTGYSISTQNEPILLNIICALINSNFSKYYLSLTSASWGIERERVQANETLELPSFHNIKKIDLKKITSFVNDIISKKKNFLNNNTAEIEKQIEKYILEKVLNLSASERHRISDIINYSLDLFESKEKSKALLPTTSTDNYTNMLCSEINNFLEEQDLYANATIYNINRYSPLMMIKISFNENKKELNTSNENISNELKRIDKLLWEKKSENIYFRKKMNYKEGNDVYIIKPNQRRFWTQTMAMEDASELILEILTEE